MKKQIFTLIALFLFVIISTFSVNAQAPEGFLFQAQAMNKKGKPIKCTCLTVKITIMEKFPDGTVVWEGDHKVKTDAYGLFTLVIGEGTGGSYSFSDIDWANYSHFLNVRVDDKGTWVDMGTTQFLSVPYALHANTVSNINEADPIFSNSQAANITDNDIFKLENLSGINTGDQDLSSFATQSALEDTAAAIRSSIPYYSIGDFAQGGIVFWVDETRQHGLVCAKEDQSTAIRWNAGSIGNTHAKGDGPLSGESNTVIIIAAQVAIGDDGSTYAARICNEFITTESEITYGDWYLPSKGELDLMYQHKESIDASAMTNGGEAFEITRYWSSSENTHYDAWSQSFGNGSQAINGKSAARYVRAVRAF